MNEYVAEALGYRAGIETKEGANELWSAVVLIGKIGQGEANYFNALCCFGTESEAALEAARDVERWFRQFPQVVVIEFDPPIYSPDDL